MAYKFYLDGVQLPITPGKLTLNINNRNETIYLINDGEINILKAAGLTTINFEFIIPAMKYVFADDFKPVIFYFDLLERLKTSLRPFQFVVDRNLPTGRIYFKTNMTVSLEDYEIIETAENGFDVAFRVNLKQFKPTSTYSMTITENGVTATKINSDTKIQSSTYKIQPGDTLWSIAKVELGNGSDYVKLAQINSISDPNNLAIGQIIKLMA